MSGAREARARVRLEMLPAVDVDGGETTLERGEEDEAVGERGRAAAEAGRGPEVGAIREAWWSTPKVVPHVGARGISRQTDPHQPRSKPR